jgi:hypothetical protein
LLVDRGSVDRPLRVTRDSLMAEYAHLHPAIPYGVTISYIRSRPTLDKGIYWSAKVTRLFGIEHLVAPNGTDEKNPNQ